MRVLFRRKSDDQLQLRIFLYRNTEPNRRHYRHAIELISVRQMADTCQEGVTLLQGDRDSLVLYLSGNRNELGDFVRTLAHCSPRFQLPVNKARLDKKGSR